MARSWVIDCRGIASKVKNASLPPANQIKDCGANLECPNCHCRIDNTDVSNEWPGLPAGVKFDPTDVEIMEHLAAKCSLGSSKPHMFIDEFIPTVYRQEGICYTHPENLPGAKKDGSSVHFFHKTTNAYAIGQRKRRKIHNQHSLIKGDVRWHKTGKTKRVEENGVLKGYKKIMVLYTISKKGSKAEKSDWVMHQYHLGTDEDEIEGHYVVSKIFYQHKKQNNDNECPQVVEESDMQTIRTGPRTPNTNAPNPPRRGKSVLYDDVTDDYALQEQQAVFLGETSFPSSSAAPQFKDDTDTHCWLAGESQAVEGNDANDSLLCNEDFGSYVGLDDPVLNYGPFSAFARVTDDLPEVDGNVGCGVADLENLELDTAPDNLPDLQFGSQDSILGWLDNI